MAELPATGGAGSGELEALLASVADRAAPARLAYLSALARRAADQPEAVRRRLTAKIAREVAELAAQPRLPPAAEAEPGGVPAASPLAELLAYIASNAAASPKAPAAVRAASHPQAETRPAQARELKSVAYFRTTWSRLSTEQQLTQTLAQAPENAGPMNSQNLVLSALKLMRDCSPDYLQGFMSYVDTLIWLEQASAARPNADRSPAREKKAKPGTRS